MHVAFLRHHASRDPPHGGQYMTDPLEVKVNQSATVNQNIDHQFALVRHSDKSEAIARFLDLDPELYGVVFCRTRRDTQALGRGVAQARLPCRRLARGDVSGPTGPRDVAVQAKALAVLVATDVAARGIDVDNLTHVFHHSLPGEAALLHPPLGPNRPCRQEGHLLGADERQRARSFEPFGSRRWALSLPRAMVPNPEEIVHARMTTWGQGLIELPAGRGVPEDIWEQMSLLFGELSKEDVACVKLSLPKCASSTQVARPT